MIKLRHTFLLALVMILCYGCPGDTGITEFNHEAQAVKDAEFLIEFLESNYYDAAKDSIKPLKSGEIALKDDPKLKTKNVTYTDINYKLYYYVNRVGTPNPVKDFPTYMDSVLVNYNGQSIVKKDSLSSSFDRREDFWLMLSGVIPGWSEGFQHFKGGENITGNGPITFQNFGKGILILPSGLAYRNIAQSSIPASSSLVFYIELLDIVENTDQDQDGLASILEVEDASKESDPRKVDTDGDGIPNYNDADDDNDGILTKDEDANGDGDPRNDFSDPKKPTVPDYLNPDIK